MASPVRARIPREMPPAPSREGCPVTTLFKLALLAGSALALTACGGNDVAHALNLGAPQARLVNAASRARLTPAATKTVFFSGALNAGDHDDLLLVTLPTSDGLGVKILDIPSASGESNADIANSL